MNKKKLKTYQRRYLLLILGLAFLLFLAFYLIEKSFASYISSAKLNTKIDRALYILNEGEYVYNINEDGLIPRDEDYVYNFSISNYREEETSDVDMEYNISITTTTNLPLTYKLYKQNTTTDIITKSSIEKDADGSFYNFFEVGETFNFTYQERREDIYSLIINFPKRYYQNINYADSIEMIQVKVTSKQIIE